jgi:hypothetical protein
LTVSAAIDRLIHHDPQVEGKSVRITGYVVRTNYGDAPACSLHAHDRGDDAGCPLVMPKFAIADTPAEKTNTIDVMGWASNFAQVYSMIRALDAAPEGGAAAVEITDYYFGTPIPNPVPNVGAKVVVSGTYAVTFTRSPTGVIKDPAHGILTASRVEYLEPPREKALLPGMKLKKK